MDVFTKEGVEKHFLDLECVRSSSKPRKSKGRTIIQLNVDVCSCQRKQYSGKKTHQLTMSTSKNRDVFKVIKNLRRKLLQHRTKDCDLKLPPPVFSIFNLFRPKSPTDRSHSRKRKVTDMHWKHKTMIVQLNSNYNQTIHVIRHLKYELHIVQQKFIYQVNYEKFIVQIIELFSNYIKIFLLKF